MLQAALGIFRPYKGKTIWLPHGLSDKGWKSPFFEALQSEDLLLVYGQRMRDVLKEKNISLPQLSIGNFRKEFYLQHRSFYDALLPDRRAILYAPTWEDGEQNGTFWHAFPKLIEQIPQDKHLFVKVHPNTQRKYAHQLEQFPKGSYTWIENFPPIYPLLNKTDIYIGDMSSIGYDFITFHRPLFFLRKEKTDPAQDPSAFLMQSGTQITLDEIPTIYRSPAPVNHQKLISYAFDEAPNWTKNLEQFLQTNY
jgi:CDP-glycerol glycerophosphotransferase (TagB/SpsB family)